MKHFIFVRKNDLKLRRKNDMKILKNFEVKKCVKISEKIR